MLNDVKAVADYIIDEINAYNEKHPGKVIILSNRRLQRLLYLCDVSCMIQQNDTFVPRPLFWNDFYVGAFGPIIPSVCTIYVRNQFGNMEPYMDKYNQGLSSLSDYDKEIINNVLRKTVNLDCEEIESITNVDSGPWDITKRNMDEANNKNAIIPKELIYDYHSKNGLFESNVLKHVIHRISKIFR